MRGPCLRKFILLVSLSDTCSFGFRHSLWLLFVAALAVLKRLMVEKGLRGGISHAIDAFKNYEKSKNHHTLSIGMYIMYMKKQCCLWMVLSIFKIYLNLI